MKKIITVLLLIPNLLIAQTMYKCPSEQGIKFQQLPCDNGQSVTVKPLSNGKGADQSSVIEYSKKLSTAREQKEVEREISMKEYEKEKAIQETMKEKGIVNGVSNLDRYCSDWGASRSYCEQFQSK